MITQDNVVLTNWIGLMPAFRFDTLGFMMPCYVVVGGGWFSCAAGGNIITFSNN